MKKNYKIGIIENSRELDGTWNFEYIQLNEDQKAQAEYDGSYDETNPDKSIYPEGTIFLDSDYDDVYASTSIENIIINTKGPTVLKDETKAISFKDYFEASFTIESDSLIDIRQLKIDAGEVSLFSITRKDGIYNSGNIDEIEVYKNNNTYELTFKIIPKTVSDDDKDDLVELLNSNQLTIKVFDVNANGVEYTTDHVWKFIDWNDDLEKLQIEFIEKTPEDMILDDNIEGKVLVSVYNPNTNLVEAGITPLIKLNDESIGEIDWTSYDESEYETEGVIKFYIININTNGKIIVDAWIDIDNIEYKQLVYNKTFTEAELGPWIYADADGRKIKLMSYPPNYMKDDKYYTFTKWTETFLNTMYKSLSNGKNIGILEKIARIGHFNDIDKIESTLLDHYSNEFGIEINPALDELQNFLIQKRVTVNNDYETVTAQKYIYEDFTDDELREFLKFIYREIPEYNQYKGSYKGIKMALNMIGLCVKLVELWSKKDDENVNDFLRSDEINDYPFREDKTEGALISNYFLTSRFDVDVEESQITFEEFNEYSNNIVRLILQVKPVTRLLNKISYIFYFYTDLHFSFWWLPFINTQDFHHFTYTWNLLNKYSLTKTHWNMLNDKLYNINRIYIPYVAKDASVTFKSQADHNWTDAGETSKGDIITRKAVKNTYYNLRNLEYKSKINNNEKIYFTVNCQVETKTVKYKLEDVKEKILCPHCHGSFSLIEQPTYNEAKYHRCFTCFGNGYINQTVSQIKKIDTETKTIENIFDNNFTLPLKDWSTVKKSDNIITIENDQNGFYLVFNGTTNALLAGKLDQKLLEAGDNIYVLYEKSEDEMTYIYKKILNFSITMNFDLVLGLNIENTHLPDTDCKVN